MAAKSLQNVQSNIKEFFPMQEIEDYAKVIVSEQLKALEAPPIVEKG